MKIIRYRDSQQGTYYGAEQADGSVRRIEGSIFGDYRVTDEVADVQKLLAPIQPTQLLGIGLNYRRHAEETGAKLPEFPIVFFKNLSALQHPGDPIELPTLGKSAEVDYECELAIVIGKPCKNVSQEDAFDYVLGYTAANDVSARDWQKKWGGSQWNRGKSFDTFCPMGPRLVTTDEIPNPNALKIATVLNGERVQDWNTDDMIFGVAELVSFLSQSTTLLPGTVILTGTPHGVGMARDPQVWLQPGDTVTIELEGIGELTNPVTGEA